eukprot:Protomagalhaensia_sp_Gyna_25__2756@NODE_258_length_4147_cov_14_802337_g199_i0_p3_GENE_NODE_258_length_4147_cov_14_802337_g199_i0NODE_258_length_4147_cov_14_802337_g199_i0_p3_ORF_typecomplete_len322_score56_21_NODE_258_length_4147_cov_14_802337_g199_i017122677
MSEYSSTEFEEPLDEEEEARFYPPPGETEEDGWEFDGLDWVQYDGDDIPWVFDGEEMAMKDEEGNIYVQRDDGVYLKDGDELFWQNEDGEWYASGEEPPAPPEEAATQALVTPAAAAPVAKWAEKAALAMMDGKSLRMLNLADLLGVGHGDEVMPNGGTLFRGHAPTAAEYFRTFTSYLGPGPAIGDTIRQLQQVCRILVRLTRRFGNTPADRLIYGCAATLLDLFDSTTAEAGGDLDIVKPAIAALFKNNGGDLRDLHIPMRKRAVSLLKCRLDMVAAQIAMVASVGSCPSAADVVLYRLCLSMRALIHSVSRSISLLVT